MLMEEMPLASFFVLGMTVDIVRGERGMIISKYEQETIINYNAGERIASVYTRDKAVMRKIDALVTEFPEYYRLTRETDIDKTYEMPKSYVNYRRPRKLTKEQRKNAVERARKLRQK